MKTALWWLTAVSYTHLHENLESNQIPEDRFQVVQGNIIDDPVIQEQAGIECYDIAAANILAPVIILLQGEITKHLKHGGIFITSGIINMKAVSYTHLDVYKRQAVMEGESR